MERATAAHSRVERQVFVGCVRITYWLEILGFNCTWKIANSSKINGPGQWVTWYTYSLHHAKHIPFPSVFTCLFAVYSPNSQCDAKLQCTRSESPSQTKTAHLLLSEHAKETQFFVRKRLSEILATDLSCHRYAITKVELFTDAFFLLL